MEGRVNMTTYPWQNLDPKGLVQVTQPQWISDIDQQVLSHLYQPIIGAEAYAFYHTLYANIQPATFTSDPLRHFDLMEQMVAGKEQYIKARRSLEAIGLLQVFEKRTDASQDEITTIYQLQAPLNSKHIFSDPIMSSLLMDRLGQDRYQQVIEKFSNKLTVDVKNDDWVEVTASFQDVYRLPSQYYPISGEVEDKLLAQNVNKKSIHLANSSLNMTSLKELLQASFVSEKAVTDQVKEMFISLHQLYGFDEVDLQQLAMAATDLRTNTIDVAKMQKLAVEKASQASNQASLKNQDLLKDRISENEDQQNQTEDANQRKWLSQGLDQEELAMAELAKEYPPIAFASSIKEQKGGYLTKSEGNAITDLIHLEIIQPAVLNILVQYCLIELDQSRLTRSYLETIADDWRQNKIEVPEAAMLYLKNRKQTSAENFEKRQKNRVNKGRYQSQKASVKPKWLNPENRQDKYQKPVDSKAVAVKEKTADTEEKKATTVAQESEIQQLIQSLNKKEGE